MTRQLEPGELWTMEDLERLWKPPGKTPKARRKWVQRRVQKLGIEHEKVRYEPRFLPAEVLRKTEMHLGGGKL